MSVVTWPAGLKAPAEFTISQARYDQVELSDATGHAAARIFGPPRWQVALRSVDAFSLAEAGVYEAMLLQLRGGINHLALYDFVRSAPQGTMRGTLTLNGAHVAGQGTAVLPLSVTGGAGQASTTLKMGDWLQIGSSGSPGASQLVKVVADATANGSGVIALTVEPPLRTAFSSGAAVTWDKPVAYYKQTGKPQWSYRPNKVFKQSGFALDLLESWT